MVTILTFYRHMARKIYISASSVGDTSGINVHFVYTWELTPVRNLISVQYAGKPSDRAVHSNDTWEYTRRGQLNHPDVTTQERATQSSWCHNIVQLSNNLLLSTMRRMQTYMYVCVISVGSLYTSWILKTWFAKKEGEWVQLSYSFSVQCKEQKSVSSPAPVVIEWFNIHKLSIHHKYYLIEVNLRWRLTSPTSSVILAIFILESWIFFTCDNVGKK